MHQFRIRFVLWLIWYKSWIVRKAFCCLDFRQNLEKRLASLLAQANTKKKRKCLKIHFEHSSHTTQWINKILVLGRALPDYLLSFFVGCFRICRKKKNLPLPVLTFRFQSSWPLYRLPVTKSQKSKYVKKSILYGEPRFWAQNSTFNNSILYSPSLLYILATTNLISKIKHSSLLQTKKNAKKVDWHL